MTPVAEIQHWFGKQIGSPLGTPIDDQAHVWIAPSTTLTPKERVTLYQQQYWWRLLDALQKNFPTITRLFGYDAFNTQIAIPYLSDNLPTHWALCQLGQTLPKWIEKHYSADDFTLVYTATQLDWAAQEAFWIESKPPVDFATLSEYEQLNTSFTLQPHIHLFALDADLLTFRDAFLAQEVDHWNDHPFPPLEKRLVFAAIFRDEHNNATWKALSEGEYRLLQAFQAGASIEQACSELTGPMAEEAATLLPLWFRSWTSQGWFI